MECMYANRITLTVNDREAFFKFDFVAPDYNENNEVSGEKLVDSSAVIVQRDALESIRVLIDACLKMETKKENQDETGK